MKPKISLFVFSIIFSVLCFSQKEQIQLIYKSNHFFVCSEKDTVKILESPFFDVNVFYQNDNLIVVKSVMPQGEKPENFYTYKFFFLDDGNYIQQQMFANWKVEDKQLFFRSNYLELKDDELLIYSGYEIVDCLEFGTPMCDKLETYFFER